MAHSSKPSPGRSTAASTRPRSPTSSPTKARRLIEWTASASRIAHRLASAHVDGHQRRRRRREALQPRAARCEASFDTVIDWGEKLVYTGTKDDALPPEVLQALDDYLAESNSKLLVVHAAAGRARQGPKKKPHAPP